MWQSTAINHTRGQVLSLFACDVGTSVDLAYIYKTKDGVLKFPFCDRLIGSVAEIYVDQSKTPPNWIEQQLPDDLLPELDMRAGRAKPSCQETLDYMRYHIANAINDSFHDRTFAKFARKCLVGSWSDESSVFTFSEDGTYQLAGETKFGWTGIPSTGSWVMKRNMLHLMNTEINQGNRIQIVDIDTESLLFPGGQGQFYRRYRRA